MKALIERFSALYENISSLPIFKENITAETLSLAGKMYFYLVHCADISYENVPLVSFYANLFGRHSLKTILITLARFSSLDNRSYSNDKRIALEFFWKLSGQVDLFYQDIDAVTLSLPGRRNGTTNTTADNTKIRDVINHPVHITNHQGLFSPSAFIPFCAFGGEMGPMGQRIQHFSFPVCTAFRQHLVGDQLCYEVDANQYKSGFSSAADLQTAMNIGLFLLIDQNSEYDTRKYYDTAELRSERSINNIFHHYVKLEDTTKIKIYFHTISIVLFKSCWRVLFSSFM